MTFKQAAARIVATANGIYEKVSKLIVTDTRRSKWLFLLVFSFSIHFYA